jgi:protein ImuA
MRKPLPSPLPAAAWNPDLAGTKLGRPETSLLGVKTGRPPALPANLAALRDRLRPAAGQAANGLVFGSPAVDACLPGGGLPLGQLHEVGAGGLEAETGTLPAAFAALLAARIEPTRPAFWIAPCPDLYGPGLLACGLDPGRLVMIRPDGNGATLEAMEAVLRAGVATVVVGEVGRLDRTASHRLQLACLRHGTTGIVLRRWPNGRKDAATRASIAVTRWQLAASPSQNRPRNLGPPRWIVTLTHARAGRPGEWIMEVWKDAPLGLRVVAPLADHPATAQRLAG